MEDSLNKTLLEDPLYVRNNGIHETKLNYQSLEAVEKNGIPFNLALALTILDKVNSTFSLLIELYTERGLGKLLVNHNVEFINKTLSDWKYTDISKLLWTQVSLILQFKRKMEEIEKDCLSLADNIVNLYTQKEFPIIPDVMKDAFIKVFDLHFIADIVFSQKKSLRQTYEKFLELPVTSQQTVAETNHGETLMITKMLSENYFRNELIEKIKPYHLDNVIETLINYISFYSFHL